MPVTTTITALPPAPNRGMDVVEFSDTADAWVAAIALWTTQTNAVGTEVNGVATAVNTALGEAQTAAINAASSASLAIGASNYKGEWSALAGALNIPASVSYNGQIWILKENIANVAAEVPGVSSKWFFHNAAFPLIYTDLAAGTPSINIGASIHYGIRNAAGNTNPQELIAPANPSDGAYIVMTVLNGLRTNTFNPNGKTVEGNGEILVLNLIRTYFFRYMNGAWRIL